MDHNKTCTKNKSWNGGKEARRGRGMRYRRTRTKAGRIKYVVVGKGEKEIAEMESKKTKENKLV